MCQQEYFRTVAQIWIDFDRFFIDLSSQTFVYSPSLVTRCTHTLPVCVYKIAAFSLDWKNTDIVLPADSATAERATFS